MLLDEIIAGVLVSVRWFRQTIRHVIISLWSRVQHYSCIC